MKDTRRGPNPNRHLRIIPILFLVVILMAGCASKWKAAYGVAAWTDKNMESLDKWYQQGSEDEKAILRAYVNPPMNIMKHACLAIEAIEKNDDIALGNEIMIITKIGYGWGKSFPGLLQALKEKNVEEATNRLQGIQLYVQEQAGIEQPVQEKGFIRSAWESIVKTVW